MNQIAWLESSIFKGEELLADKQRMAQDRPNSFSASLTLKSMENHLSDLRQQLHLEKEKRNKEVVEFRFSGQLVDHGTMPLHLVAKIADKLSSASHRAAYWHKKGKEAGAKIPEYIIHAMNLRLAGLAAGSTKLIISSSCNPDLFGRSIAEDVLKKQFAVLRSENGQELTDAVSEIGIKATRSLADFVKILVNENVQLDATWQTPTNDVVSWIATSERLISLSESLASIASDVPIVIEVAGILSSASIKGKFELDGQDGVSYAGRFSDDLLPIVRKSRIGDQVHASIEVKTTYNQTTGYEKKRYSLLHLIPS